MVISCRVESGVWKGRSRVGKLYLKNKVKNPVHLSVLACGVSFSARLLDAANWHTIKRGLLIIREKNPVGFKVCLLSFEVHKLSMACCILMEVD